MIEDISPKNMKNKKTAKNYYRANKEKLQK